MMLWLVRFAASAVLVGAHAVAITAKICALADAEREISSSGETDIEEREEGE